MAETFGFFDAQEISLGVYDREYDAQQFAKYFSLFVGNGVFGSPTNQLKVSAGTGLSVKVNIGFAFINGKWYHNDTEKIINLTPNTTGFSRADAIMCRLNETTRTISTIEVINAVAPVRDIATYDLMLATYILAPSATSISDAIIVDRRIEEDVCGLVTSLLEVQTTEDLFAQYEAQFNSWFDNLVNQLSDNQATNLQNQIGNLTQLNTTDKTNLTNAVNEVNNKTGTLAQLATTVKTNLVNAINEVFNNVGVIANLQTTVKTSIVNAINWLFGALLPTTISISYILNKPTVPVYNQTYRYYTVPCRYANLYSVTSFSVAVVGLGGIPSVSVVAIYTNAILILDTSDTGSGYPIQININMTKV